MRQRQSVGGLGLLVLILLLFMLFSLRGQGVAESNTINFPEFERYLENDNISSAVIRPNRETPTGEVEFVTKSG